MQTLALTYREIADRLGIKPESARKTAQRRRWHRVTGNDGTVRIHVPVEVLEGEGDSHGDRPGNPVHAQLAKLEAEVAGLKELVQAERRRAEAAETAAAMTAALMKEREADLKAERDRWHEQAQRLALAAPARQPRGVLSRLLARSA
ncbi:hypothetical protein [Phyllobacterium leguminum]|uniref:hypothetical protein n=1 Tax=Phyllobacterium leguminum TaxID=314237 RepID=UPI000DA14016|nr:hypothetical protein [Phyllobacterium leguminum]